jgi:thiol-disulfide isomerase/thioredoxin
LKKLFAIISLILLIFSSGAGAFINFKSGDRAPEFALSTLDGTVIRLSDYLGKIVIVDFWATWCGPCRMAIPDLVELQNEYKDDLIIIGISLDQPYTQKNLKPFIESYSINYPIVLGNIEVVEAYGNIRGIPTSFIVNQNGEIVNRFTGYVPKSYYTNDIDQLLNSSE